MLLVLLLVFPLVVSQHWNVDEGKACVQDDLPGRLKDAADYIAGRYDEGIGLVSESECIGSNVPDMTPCNRTFWIYSDNLWACEVLKPFYPSIAQNISATLSRYIARFGSSGLYEVALGTKIAIPIHANRNVSVDWFIQDHLNHTVWADRHKPKDGEVFYDEQQYADLVFYISLNYFLEHDNVAAEHWFRMGEAMWNGWGFFDKAAENSSQYQNYKLGLFLLTAKVTGFNSSIHDSVEAMAWSCQLANGGIASLRHFNGTLSDMANVETTSVLLLSYTGRVVASFKQLKIGAYYYTWWGIPFNDHWKIDDIKGTPFFGQYNSSDPTIAAEQILLARAHKIDFFAVSWIGQGNWIDWDFDDVDRNLRDGLLQAPNIGDFKFCLFYETGLVLGNTSPQNFTSIFLNDMAYAAQNYFSNPNYLTVEGKPVFFIYNLPYLYDRLGVEATHKLFDDVKQQLTQMGKEIFVIGDVQGEASPQTVPTQRLYSLDAATSYLYRSDLSVGWTAILDDAKTYLPSWKTSMNLNGVEFVPNVYPGYNNTGNEEYPTVLDPDELTFKELLSTAIRNVDDELEIVMITSWNEWKEATSIEPSKESGELLLHTVYETVNKRFSLRDLEYVILIFNSRPPSQNWDSLADTNGDAVVNMRDIAAIISNLKHESNQK